MKNLYRFSLIILTFLFITTSCSSDDKGSDSEIITLTFTQYISTTTNLDNPTLLPISTKSGESSSFYRFVEGFDYELRVLETSVNPPLQDASDTRYELTEVVSKTPEAITEIFEV